MLPRDVISAAVRMAARMSIVVVLLVTAWVCLVSAFVVMLRPALGLDGALLVVAVATAAMSALIALVVRVARETRPAATRSNAQLAGYLVSAIRVVSSALSRRADQRFLLIGVALLAAGLAVWAPPEDTKSRD